MTKSEPLLIRIVNLETNEASERELNSEELARWEADQEIERNKAEAIANAEIAKAALLEKLGITQEEAKLLLS